MRLLDRYVLSKFAPLFLGGLFCAGVLLGAGMILGAPDSGAIHLLEVTPFTASVAALLMFSNLSRSRELVALAAAGVCLFRTCIAPFAFAFTCIAALALVSFRLGGNSPADIGAATCIGVCGTIVGVWTAAVSYEAYGRRDEGAPWFATGAMLVGFTAFTVKASSLGHYPLFVACCAIIFTLIACPALPLLKRVIDAALKA